MASYNAQNQFIDNYRNIQAENTAQIGTQAHALGSDLAAPQGGLHGPSSYWKSRYQTPQTESRVAELRASNQAQALNQLMQNDLAREQDKYNQAARAANARANNPTTTTTSDYDSTQGKVNFTSLESLGRAGTVQPGISSTYDTETLQPTGTTIIAEGVDENGNAKYVEMDAAGNVIRRYTESGSGASRAEAQRQGIPGADVVTGTFSWGL